MNRSALLLMLAFGIVCAIPMAQAQEAERASHSPIAGINFTDAPTRLPVTDSFQDAMHSVASDLGRHCQTIEAYGWRLSQAEQQRVNDIFNATTTQLAAGHYTLVPRTPSSASREVTVFTAEQEKQSLLFLWSAGELGLVMLICDTQEGVMAIPQSLPEETAMPTPKPKSKKEASPKEKKPQESKVKQDKTKASQPVKDKSAEKPKKATKEKQPTTASGSEILSPEVKAMLDSLPEVPPEPVTEPDAPAAMMEKSAAPSETPDMPPATPSQAARMKAVVPESETIPATITPVTAPADTSVMPPPAPQSAFPAAPMQETPSAPQNTASPESSLPPPADSDLATPPTTLSNVPQNAVPQPSGTEEPPLPQPAPFTDEKPKPEETPPMPPDSLPEAPAPVAPPLVPLQ